MKKLFSVEREGRRWTRVAIFGPWKTSRACSAHNLGRICTRDRPGHGRVSVDDTPCHGRAWNLINCRPRRGGGKKKKTSSIFVVSCRIIQSDRPAWQSIFLWIDIPKIANDENSRFTLARPSIFFTSDYIYDYFESRKLVGRTWLTAIPRVYMRFISLSCANEGEFAATRTEARESHV